MEAQAAELVSHGALTQGVGSPAAGFGEISVERDRLALGLEVEHAGGVWAEFAADSSLEGRVTSELVSEVDSGARKNQNQIFRGFWMIPASENAVSLEKSTR